MVIFTYDRQNKVWIVSLKNDCEGKGKDIAVLEDKKINWFDLRYSNNDIINHAIQTFQKI